MSVQHCHPRSRVQSRTQNMFCMKDGRKYFDKSFKQLFRYRYSSFEILEMIRNEANHCSVNEMTESSGETLLHLAAKYGHAEVATYLLSNGCEVDARNGECGSTPLMLSAAYGHINVCLVLLDANADIFATNYLGESALYGVTTSNRFISDESHLNVFFKKLKSLKLSNDELATKLIQANSPMYYIVQLNKAVVTVKLRDRGYKVQKSYNKGSLLLHDAVALRNLENVKFVLEQMDLDVNFLDDYDYAPMHYAAENGDVNGNVSIIKFLLEKGADINIRGLNGITPLYAVFKGYLTIEQKKHCTYFLLQQGADPQMLDFNGDTVIDYAMDETIEDFDETLLDSVFSHLALQEALGLPIIDKLREQIDSNRIHKFYYISCKRCLEDMKKMSVIGDITMFKILTESEKKIFEYMRDSQLATSLSQIPQTIFDSNFYYRYILMKRFIMVMDMIENERQKNSV